MKKAMQWIDYSGLVGIVKRTFSFNLQWPDFWWFPLIGVGMSSGSFFH
jgi:hypothetical protein